MSKFGFDRVIKNFERLKNDLPVVVANKTQNFFADSWRKQGWDDTGVKAWEPRKYETPKTKGKAILVSTGKLRRAVQNSIREKRFERIHLVIDGGSIPYAKIHNEGLRAGRGAGFIMPKRQFMGDSKALRKIQIETIKKQIDKVWK